MDFVRNFYRNIDLPDGPFGFSHEKQRVDILEKFDTNKAAGIDGLSGIFLKDGAKTLSISLSSVPDSCKVAKLKPLFKKGSKLEQVAHRGNGILGY